MEDVLEVYTRPTDPTQPLICFDELSKQQVKEVRTPIPPAPGQPERYDYEYERNGTSNLFTVISGVFEQVVYFFKRFSCSLPIIWLVWGLIMALPQSR
jgi:hypothetical protein